jgi:hypothetical protein
MRVGTMFLGTVDSLESESIQTQFFILGVPLFPMQSYYVTEETGGGISGYPIDIHPKSVVLGYVRIYLWVGAVISGVLTFLEDDWHTTGGIACAVMLALAVATTFFVGGLSPQEHKRRSLLREVSGVGAPPEYVPRERLDGVLDRALAVWSGANPGADWKAAIEAGRGDPILFLIAEYSFQSDLAAQVLSRRL